MPGPFEDDFQWRSASDLGILRRWLEANVKPNRKLAPDGYSVNDLIKDMKAIEDGITDAFIEGMGEDR